MSRGKSAFEQLASSLVDDALKTVAAKLGGTPYIRKWYPVQVGVRYLILQAKEDHMRHYDVGVGGASKFVTRGTIVKEKLEHISPHNIDMSKWDVIGDVEEMEDTLEWRGYK